MDDVREMLDFSSEQAHRLRRKLKDLDVVSLVEGVYTQKAASIKAAREKKKPAGEPPRAMR